MTRCGVHLIGERCLEPVLSHNRCFKHLSWKLTANKERREELLERVRELDIEIDRLETILEV